MQVSDQLTGMLEVRAKTDEAAAAGQDIIQGFLTEPEAGAVYRYAPAAVSFAALQTALWLYTGPCHLVGSM